MGETSLVGKLSKKVGGSNPNATTLIFRYETAVTIKRTSGCLLGLSDEQVLFSGGEPH